MRLELEGGKSLVQKIVGAEILPEQKEGQIIAMISTEAIDSDGDIIHQDKTEWGEGWELDRYNKHPVMLWGHDHQRPSIGKAAAYLDTHNGKQALFATAEFDPEDEFAQQIEGKIRRGIISETSVGFVASTYGAIDLDHPWDGYHFWQQELIEFSWENRGANPDVESFIKSACQSCPGMGKIIETHNDPLLNDMRMEFLDRMKTVAGSISLGFMATDRETKNWETISALAKQIADTQEQIRGGKT